MKFIDSRTRLVTSAFLAVSLLTAVVSPASAQQSVSELARRESLLSQPSALLGFGAIAVGTLSLARGITLIAMNGDRCGSCENSLNYTGGPVGFLWLGAGAVSAMAGAALVDWAAVDPSRRSGRSARVRRWSYAAIGAGTLLASVGGALVLNEQNERENVGDPKLTAGRAFGWPAAVLGTAVALAGIEGLAIDVFSANDSDPKPTLGLTFRGRF